MYVNQHFKIYQYFLHVTYTQRDRARERGDIFMRRATEIDIPEAEATQKQRAIAHPMPSDFTIPCRHADIQCTYSYVCC